MSKSTPATAALAKAGIAFELHTYVYDPTVSNAGFCCTSFSFPSLYQR